MADTDAGPDGGADRGAVASPCTGVCTLHPRLNLCAGCLRSLDEIAAWPGLDAPARRAILALLPEREALMRKRPRLGAGLTAGRPGP